MAKTVKIWFVLFDGRPDGPAGPAGDGTFTKRFGKGKAAEKEARGFAAENTYLGKPAAALEQEASRETARRWGFA